MLLDRLRVPRLLLGIPALRPLLVRLSELRQKHLPRPSERVPHPIAEGARNEDNPNDALSLAWGRVAGAPGDINAWLNLGVAEYAAQLATVTKEVEGHGAPAPRKSAQPPTDEDTELLAMLDHPAQWDLPPHSLSDRVSLPKLKQMAEAIASENLALARRIEPLRQQLGFRVDALETWIKYEHTKYYMRALALYMRRYGVRNDLPTAPSTIPASVQSGFATGGVAQIQMGYLNAAYPEPYRDIYTDFDLETFQRAWRGEPVAPDNDRQCQADFILTLGETDQALQRAAHARLSPNDSVAVIGSRGPVYEALSLACGARPTTVRRTAVINRAKELRTTTFALWEADPHLFDAAIAVSVVEQAGLGMHGEPLDPEGDIALMRVLKRLVKPNGLLFLVVPTGADCTVFNATRVYGDRRLPQILTGWTVIERHQHQDPMIHGRGENRSLFVLANAA